MASRKPVFSAADDEQLVELVAGHKIQCDISDDQLKKVLKKELIWKEIDKQHFYTNHSLNTKNYGF